MSHIGVTDPEGRRKVYRVKSFDAMTIADWRAITSQPIEATDPHEVSIELLCRHTTIPRSALRRMPASEVARLLDAIGDYAVALSKAKEEADKGLDLRTFVHDGVTYAVPQDLENDVTFGQFEDLDKILLPKCESDADMHATICASLCLPQGEEYDGAKVMARIAAFETLPVHVALKVFAFFFGSSEWFRTVTRRCLSRMTTMRLHNVEQALTHLQHATDPS